MIHKNHICRWCKKPYDWDQVKDPVWRIEYCNESCNEQYYLKYRCGFIPRKYKDLPIVNLSGRFMDKIIKKINKIELKIPEIRK